MATHLQKGQVVTDPRMRDEAIPYAFCGRCTGACRTSIVRKKCSGRCPCVVTLKQAVFIRKQDNVPREYPNSGCNATLPIFRHQSSLGTLPSHSGTEHI